MPSDDIDDSKVVEDVHVHSEISGIVEDSLVNLGIPIIDVSHVPSAGINDVNVPVDSRIPTPNEIYIHEENQESQETDVESIPIVSSSN